MGSEIIELDDAILCKSGGKDRKFGTDFIVGSRLKNKVMDFKPISERICSIRIKGNKRNISIMNIHAPTEEKDEEEKDLFYEMLDNEYEKLPIYDIKIVMGDCNAKVGQEEMYRATVGRHSKHEITNDNG